MHLNGARYVTHDIETSCVRAKFRMTSDFHEIFGPLNSHYVINNESLSIGEIIIEFSAPTKDTFCRRKNNFLIRKYMIGRFIFCKYIRKRETNICNL